MALDDGLYPDTEESRIRWEGCDGTAIEATTRIPLAVDSAASFLRFRYGRYSQRLMDRDLATVRDLYRSNGFRDAQVTAKLEDD